MVVNVYGVSACGKTRFVDSFISLAMPGFEIVVLNQFTTLQSVKYDVHHRMLNNKTLVRSDATIKENIIDYFVSINILLVIECNTKLKNKGVYNLKLDPVGFLKEVLSVQENINQR